MTRPYKKRARRRTPRIVNHHITYDPKWTVPIFDGEHMILTRMQWRKRISVGFITALEEFVKLHRRTAENLKKEADKG